MHAHNLAHSKRLRVALGSDPLCRGQCPIRVKPGLSTMSAISLLFPGSRLNSDIGKSSESCQG